MIVLAAPFGSASPFGRIFGFAKIAFCAAVQNFLALPWCVIFVKLPRRLSRDAGIAPDALKRGEFQPTECNSV